MVLATPSSHRGDNKEKITVTQLVFDKMLREASYESWFTKNLRCSRLSFLEIARFLRERGVVFANAAVKQHSYEKKVAAALFFLASVSGYREAGGALGMSKSYVIDIVDEVVRVLCEAADAVICFPHNKCGWVSVERHFAARCGYPGVVGAVDGSLVAIQRPEDFDGFYCRKGYPALNVQAIVTANCRFMSVEIRPGSWSDKKSWKYSYIGQHSYDVIPAGTHFIGDAGHALLPNLIVPYAEREEGGSLTQQQHHFNTLHSSTRMAVERTFGLWKGRLRALQKVLDEKTVDKTVRVVTATVVLHNLMIDLRDSTRIKRYKEPSFEEPDDSVQLGSALARQIGKQKREDITNLICH
ncbi:hypothetical protein PF008_g25818 [Phytophthora fragariae]|uniref:DDE Tnp4 domain-containing protein n=2 Tax=Phytophthora fragariae TaxID=53985 RepID=A0A6G0QIV0_9STRA|nr:hypothetical protein PF008_g25818 [Phytophthora fragariae]